ncbi:hypothetical protein GWK47_022548 [Chionoecetes opilio]|uniref:Uncharacterized protein n=1 Tax=Chionoecetes opilio TaxID=41210 RepID=A0A8J4XWV7_CHIOP|nr:hypothetical protein GWK47_022548 [Chionoecetes opilio]
MAQYLQGLMEEGMGSVETPPAGSGRVGTAAWSNLPPYHTATRYNSKPRHHTHHSAATLANYPQHRHARVSRPGGANRGHVAGDVEAWATSVEDYRSICGWAHPSVTPYYASLCNTEVQQRIDARWASKCCRHSSTTEAIDVVISVYQYTFVSSGLGGIPSL